MAGYSGNLKHVNYFGFVEDYDGQIWSRFGKTCLSWNHASVYTQMAFIKYYYKVIDFVDSHSHGENKISLK